MATLIDNSVLVNFLNPYREFPMLYRVARADIQVGLNIMFNDQPCRILEFKPIVANRANKSPAYTYTRLKNLWTGAVFEHH